MVLFIKLHSSQHCFLKQTNGSLLTPHCIIVYGWGQFRFNSANLGFGRRPDAGPNLILNLKLNWTHTWCGHPHLSPRHVSSRTTLRTPPALVSRLIIPPGSWPLIILQILYILLTCLTITHSHQHFIFQPFKISFLSEVPLLYVSCNNKLVQETAISKHTKEGLSNLVAFKTEMMYCTSSGKANRAMNGLVLPNILCYFYVAVLFPKNFDPWMLAKAFSILIFLQICTNCTNLKYMVIPYHWSFWETEFLWRICN